MSTTECQFGAVDCDRPATAMTVVEGKITRWSEARCDNHLCATYKEYEA